MRFDIIRQPLSVTMVLFALLLIVFWGRHILLPLPQEGLTALATPLGGWINGLTDNLNEFRLLPAMVMIFINAMMVTRIMTNNMVLAVRTYISAIIYLIVSCGVFVSDNMLCAALSGYLLIRASQLFIVGFRRALSFDLFFRGAFLVGVSVLIYVPSAVMVLMLPIALKVFRRNGRESFIAFGGLLIPILLYVYICWAAGYPLHEALHECLINSVGYDILSPDMGIARMIFMGALILVTSISIGTYTANARMMRNKASRIYTFFIYVLVISLGMMAMPCRSTADYAILALPLAVITPAYFVKNTGSVALLLWVLLLGSVIAANILPSL